MNWPVSIVYVLAHAASCRTNLFLPPCFMAKPHYSKLRWDGQENISIHYWLEDHLRNTRSLNLASIGNKETPRAAQNVLGISLSAGSRPKPLLWVHSCRRCNAPWYLLQDFVVFIYYHSNLSTMHQILALSSNPPNCAQYARSIHIFVNVQSRMDPSESFWPCQLNFITSPF